MKIMDLPEVTSVENDQVMVVDGGGLPTSKIKVKNLNLGSSGGGNIIANPEDEWVYHRNTYRGKNLGTVYTDEQKAAVSSGTFDDLYVGDYWTIGNFDWIIADINYWLNTGESNNTCTTPHLVVVPKKTLYNTKMNNNKSTNGGYLGSDMYMTGLNQAKTIIYTAFGENNILNHSELFVNAVTNGVVSSSTFTNSKVDLMNQSMVYGSKIFDNIPGQGAATNASTIDKTQLPLFRLRPELIVDEQNHTWLRDIVSSTLSAVIGKEGIAWRNYVDMDYGVRPAFGLIG